MPSHEVLNKLYYFNNRKNCFLSYKSTLQFFHNMLSKGKPRFNDYILLYSLLSSITFIQSQGLYKWLRLNKPGKQVKARNDKCELSEISCFFFILYMRLNDLTSELEKQS